MTLVKLVSTEVNTATTAGTATSISSATCVRLYNFTTGIATVGVNTAVGAATTNFISIPSGGIEYLVKLPSDVIWSNVAIKANQVAFLN